MLSENQDIKILLKNTAKYIAPIYWVSQSELEKKTINSGTIFFVDLGGGTLGVTAAHIYRKYEISKRESKNISCQILNDIFLPEENLIDVNDDADIATFHMNSEIIKNSRKNILTSRNAAPPEVGKGVLFAGFPGGERIFTSERLLNFGIYTALATATSVSDRQISCQFTEDKIDILDLGLPPQGYDLGGISGGLVLALFETPILHWRLAGVIKEASASLEILFANRADYIQPNGIIQF